ncbi:hypothetical protein [Actinomadura sp. 21ATH]|uniref:hypothetical protein n=1 Tax=Actinomadura sp. 21ATH TaxID=1735444 RepID=UPI0035BF6640
MAPAPLRSKSGWGRPPGARAGSRLRRGERAADLARDALGSWVGVGATIVLVAAAAVSAAQRDQRAGPVTVVALVLSGLALAEPQLVLMAVRRHDHAAGERALFLLDRAHRAEAMAVEVTRELDRLHGEIARLAARVETAGHASAVRASVSDAPVDDQDTSGRPKQDSSVQGGRAVLGWLP